MSAMCPSTPWCNTDHRADRDAPHAWRWTQQARLSTLPISVAVAPVPRLRQPTIRAVLSGSVVTSQRRPRNGHVTLAAYLTRADVVELCNVFELATLYATDEHELRQMHEQAVDLDQLTFTGGES